MSKAALKKELSTFTNEQLVEVILNTYNASKEAKEYLEFFLNPDPVALFNKKIELIVKELGRTKRGGYSKARISVIRKCIKSYGQYGVGAENEAGLMLAALRLLMASYSHRHYPETLVNGMMKLASDYLAFCNRHDMLSEAVENIRSTCADPVFGNLSIRQKVMEQTTKTLASLQTDTGNLP